MSPPLEGAGRGIAGILLAAGRGRRFDASGKQDKLLHRLPDGSMVAVASARHMRAALAKVMVVVRAEVHPRHPHPDAHPLNAPLQALGCTVLPCTDADRGMAASLVHGLRATQDAVGWVIALGDMPFVAPDTIIALARAIDNGADIAAPVHGGQRGNPVAFSRAQLPRLLQLQGDQGARALLASFSVRNVPVDDHGVLRDIDTLEDGEFLFQS